MASKNKRQTLFFAQNAPAPAPERGRRGALQKPRGGHSPIQARPKERAAAGYRSKEERAREAQKRARIKEIETRLAALEEEQAALTEELAACGRDFRRAQEVTDRLAALSAESETLYEEYGGLID